MKFINEHKIPVILAGCAAVLIAIMVYFGLNSSRTTAAEDALKSSTTPVQRFFGNIADGFDDVFHSIGRIRELRNRVDELTRQNTEYEKQLLENDGMAEENDRLRRMLELRDSNPDLDLTAASVAADEPSNWFSGFTIDKGGNSGLEAGQTVISTDGFLVGKISKVGANWAEVITIIDPGFSAGAMVERSRDLGVAEGDSELRYNMQFKLSYLSRATDIQAGDYVTTTGLGGIFPSGIRIGRVAEIKDDTTNMTRYAIVDLSADLRDVREVFVITNSMDVVADEENANMKSAREEAEREQADIDIERAEAESREESENSGDDESSEDESESDEENNSGDTEDE
ncbi:MAG TPA: rod shape-determining protein MreC [Candidatus Monoglobus merdigallinarum]|uniref:Cell shape-determining protein MreC n=1 Tax=Candidatus Monoglobus merdigallinarum TaxID=2838698 RepID=A0A9D1PPS8_9FIRM|nr:rod shape-determining protein MreC [Candidatus Monoglobus merdigallinarum]